MGSLGLFYDAVLFCVIVTAVGGYVASRNGETTRQPLILRARFATSLVSLSMSLSGWAGRLR